jgi:hypothetical protein
MRSFAFEQERYFGRAPMREETLPFQHVEACLPVW